MDAPDNAPAETIGNRLMGAPADPAVPAAPAGPTAPAAPATSAISVTSAASVASAEATEAVPARSPMAWVVPPGLPPRPSHPGA
ncbi:hypothetical protein ACIOTI_11690 [Streptomyces sp. NPDC087843]|uniref:hypothetical protein n=1 Tax=Streptomyces sp. NPDC087843 TaxID=3365804 RepID=UPI00381FFE3E